MRVPGEMCAVEQYFIVTARSGMVIVDAMTCVGISKAAFGYAASGRAFLADAYSRVTQTRPVLLRILGGPLIANIPAS